MGWRSEKALTDLLEFAAQIFVVIRSECWGNGTSKPDDASRLRTIEAYADAAHNLDLIARLLREAGQPGAPQSIAMEADRQIHVIRDLVSRLPEDSSYVRWTWSNGLAILESIKSDCFTPEEVAPIDEVDDLDGWEDELDVELMEELGIPGIFPDDPTSDGNAMPVPDIDWAEEVPDQEDPVIAPGGPKERLERVTDLLIAQERAKEEVTLEETVFEQADTIRQLESQLRYKTAEAANLSARANRIETVKGILAAFGRSEHFYGNRDFQGEFSRRVSHLERMSRADDPNLAIGAAEVLSILSSIAWPEKRQHGTEMDVITLATSFRLDELAGAYGDVRDALRLLKEEVSAAGHRQAKVEDLLEERAGLLAIYQNRILRGVISQLIADSPLLDKRIARKQVRTAFEREGIAPTLGEFNARSEAEILRMYGVGPSSYLAVVDELVQAGIPSFHAIDRAARQKDRVVPDYDRVIREITGSCGDDYSYGPSESERAFLAASENAIRKAHLRIQDLTQMPHPRASEIPRGVFEERLARLDGMNDLFD